LYLQFGHRSFRKTQGDLQYFLTLVELEIWLSNLYLFNSVSAFLIMAETIKLTAGSNLSFDSHPARFFKDDSSPHFNRYF